MQPVSVIIPLYSAQLSALELKSLAQAYHVLRAYPLIIVKPESLDVSDILRAFPGISVCPFADDCFKGIEGYNRLMLSASFYKRFPESKYILIYQLDAFVFRDELLEWCAKDYDYIGAPWLEKPVYRLPLISACRYRLHQWKICKGKLSKQSLYNKVGNGGFSLRKTASHCLAVQAHEETIAYFLAQKHSHFFHEDVFWATQVPEFHYPEVREALRFSFDKYPAYCYRLNEKQLPFGCHAWYKRKMKRFWRPIIRF